MNVFTLMILLLLMLLNLVKGGLYSKENYVAVLDSETFYELVTDKKQSWMIQFYNTWCGHCQNFAPLYKKFAADVIGWKHTVKVGVIDCAEDKNSAICRFYEVHAFPTVQVFSAFAQKGEAGIPMPYELAADNVEAIVKFLLNTLTHLQAIGKGSNSWSNLQYFNGNLKNAIAATSDLSEMNVIILEQDDSIVGRQVILDLHFIQHVIFTRVNRSKGKNETVGSVMLLIDGKLQSLNLDRALRRNIKQIITKKLHIDLGDSYYKKINAEDESYPLEDRFLSSNSEKLEAYYPGDQPYKVYMVDIENALSFIFRNQFILKKVIESDHLIALKNFVEILYLCLPTRPHVHEFIERFYSYVINKSSIKGEDLSVVYDNITSFNSLLPNQQPWIGCLGSKTKYRGFPCGLWTTFHTLTVSTCNINNMGRVKEPIDVLESMHGFVKYFFSCQQCSQNFQKMYAIDARDYIVDGDDAIIWLWKAHNRVNQRLKNDRSEDPLHKKVPFPIRTTCPNCWSNDEFIEDDVLIYLKTIYAKLALSDRGVFNVTYDSTVIFASEYNYEKLYPYFALLYLILIGFVISTFLIFLSKFRRKQHSKYRYHIL